MEQELRDYREPGRPPLPSLKTLALVLASVMAAGMLVAVVAWVGVVFWFVYKMRDFT